MRKEFACVLLIVLACAGSLSAQSSGTGYEVGVFAAGVDWQSKTFQIGPPQSSTPIPLGFSYKDNQIAYGARANFLSHGHWAGELSYSYQRNTLTLSRPGFASVGLGGGIHHVFYNEVFYPVRYGGPVIPFITGGIGLAAYHLSDTAQAAAANPAMLGLGSLKSNDEQLALNYGGGVKANIAKHMGIRADFRHIFTEVPTWGLPTRSSVATQPVFPVHGQLQNFEFSVGIYFRGMIEGFR